ncbi:hypothetical protein, partial [Kyrpidia sp.]|uniref:hypothetical protein n=1 Tax=Kyrpidia sp. TaxID=2073077 RepID=UPI0025891388
VKDLRRKTGSVAQEMRDASYADWMNKIESLFHDGQSAVDNYVNAYVGRMAEDLAAAHLQAQGLQVEHFASQTHPGNDLRIHHPDGSFTEYSVKSCASTAEFHQAVAEHADSHHYIVNHELYQQLDHQELLQSYAQRGIEILDGGDRIDLGTIFTTSDFRRGQNPDRPENPIAIAPENRMAVPR